jgi:hypothetical protein
MPFKIFNYTKSLFYYRFNQTSNLYREKNSSCYQKKKTVPTVEIIKNKKTSLVKFQSFSIFLISLIFTFFFFENYKKIKNNPNNTVSAISFKEKTAFAKLQTIPVFSVVNRYGQPFLIQNKRGEHVGLIFFSHFEALEYAKDLEKYHQATNSQIYIMGLDKAFKMVNQGPTPSGIKDKYGKDLKMRFHFVPSKSEIKNANNLSKKSDFDENIPLIPVFTIEGLTINRNKENISPMFFSKDDCKKAWDKILKNDPSLPTYPDIIKGDFLKLIFFMRLDEGYKVKIQDIFNFGFVPSSKSLDFIKKENKSETSSRMIELKKVF